MQQIVHGRRRGSKMENAIDGALDPKPVRHILFGQAPAAPPAELLEIGSRARKERVHTNDIPSLIQQAPAKVGTEEAGSSGNYRSHLRMT